MNRWRARLVELQGDAFAPPAHVQNVQIVQKPPSLPPSEHFEQFEQQPEPTPAAQNDTWTDAEEERTDAEEERAAIASMTAVRRAPGPKRWRVLIRTTHRVTCGRSVGCASLMTVAVS